MAGRIFIGTSGWDYRHWGEGRFYPPSLSAKEWLTFYAAHFGTVEINNTFYRLPERQTCFRWAKQVPAGFVFAVKANRFITHIKRLKDPEESVKRFLSHLSALKKGLGPMLFQLPPQMKVDVARLEGLIGCLRRTRGLRVALEFRHESWLTDPVYRLVEDAGWTICIADWPKIRRTPPFIGPFSYIRRHGATAVYASFYSDEQLARDAAMILEQAKKGKDVYIYFNNDAEASAVRNARTLLSMVTKHC